MWCCWISPGHNPPSAERRPVSIHFRQRDSRHRNWAVSESTGPDRSVCVDLIGPLTPPIVAPIFEMDAGATNQRLRSDRPELFCWQATHLKVPTGRAQAKPNTFPATNGLRVLAAPTNNPQALAECRPLADTIFDCPPERRRFPRSIASENFGKAHGMG